METEPHPPPTLRARLQTHRLTFQSVGDKDVVSAPPHLPAGGDSPHLPVGSILDFPQPLWVSARGAAVVRGRGLLPQRLMRALVIVLLPELVEALLLRAPVASRRRSRGLLQRSMHPLMPPVLLRLARGDMLGHNPN